MTEMEILMLQAQSVQGTGMYQVAMAFSIWVAFRIASNVGQNYSDNILAKISSTIFGLGTLFFFNMTYAFWNFNMVSTGHRLAELKASGGDVSALATGFIANSGATATPPVFSVVPSDPVFILMLLAIAYMILRPTWGANK